MLDLSSEHEMQTHRCASQLWELWCEFQDSQEVVSSDTIEGKLKQLDILISTPKWIENCSVHLHIGNSKQDLKKNYRESQNYRDLCRVFFYRWGWFAKCFDWTLNFMFPGTIPVDILQKLSEYGVQFRKNTRKITSYASRAKKLTAKEFYWEITINKIFRKLLRDCLCV